MMDPRDFKTLSEYLFLSGLLTQEEYYLEQAYCRRVVSFRFCVGYRKAIRPVLWLLRYCPWLLPLTNAIAWKVWIAMAIRKQREFRKLP